MHPGAIPGAIEENGEEYVIQEQYQALKLPTPPLEIESECEELVHLELWCTTDRD